MPNIICTGPGPHVPADGVLGQSDSPNRVARCASPSCAVQVDPIEANVETLRQRARQARTANATYLSLASPTAAQNTAQVQRLTKEVNALLAVFLNALADISDSA